MAKQRCGNCRHLDRTSATDVCGLPVAICRHPNGVRIDTTIIHNAYVAFESLCASYDSRFKAPEPTHDQATGGRHA